MLEAHAASERERRKYLTLFERLPLPAVVLDRGGVVREANEAAAAVFGFAATDRLCNRSVYRMLDETARSRLHAYLAAPPSGTEEGPTTAIPVHVGRPRDGVYLSYDAHLARLPACSEEDGRVHMLLVDRHSDDRQEHERHCHQMLSESTSTLIHAFDLTGNLIFANRAASAYLDGAETLSVEQRRAFDGLLATAMGPRNESCGRCWPWPRACSSRPWQRGSRPRNNWPGWSKTAANSVRAFWSARGLKSRPSKPSSARKTAPGGEDRPARATTRPEQNRAEPETLTGRCIAPPRFARSVTSWLAGDPHRWLD
nr:PAS domain-containing protein [Rhodovulum sulfidophilum]